jgi:heme A synthase
MAMTHVTANTEVQIAPWHRKLLIVAAIFTVLLIAMGGVLCVTQSIRSCPDWPGCFGKLYPPLETSPVLEYSHRLLAVSSGLLILSAAIAGLVRARRQPWILIPPLVATVLLVEVSYFGARVVLQGIAPGWAAVDVGSALLVVALIITTAVIARARQVDPDRPDRISFRTPFAMLVLVAVIVVYAVFVSGILVAGKNSISACLGWPIYSQQLFQMDTLGAGNIIRLLLSAIGILLIVIMLIQIWRTRRSRPVIFRNAYWVLAVLLLEFLVQILLLAIGFKTSLLVVYTVTAAVFWGMLVRLGVSVGLESAEGSR